MNFLGKRNWGNAFDVFGPNGFDDIRFQEFIDGVAEVCALGLRKLSLAWDFFWECCTCWYVYAMFCARYREDFANASRVMRICYSSEEGVVSTKLNFWLKITVTHLLTLSSSILNGPYIIPPSPRWEIWLCCLMVFQFVTGSSTVSFFLVLCD